MEVGEGVSIETLAVCNVKIVILYPVYAGVVKLLVTVYIADDVPVKLDMVIVDENLEITESYFIIQG